MGRIIFVWFPCSVGMRKTLFATPPQRECDLFHFFNTSKARSSKIMKMQSSDHCFGVASSTARTANRYKNRRLPRLHFFGPKIVLRENVRFLSKINHFLKEFQQFAKFVFCENVRILSNYVNNPSFLQGITTIPNSMIFMIFRKFVGEWFWNIFTILSIFSKTRIFSMNVYNSRNVCYTNM